MNIETGKSYVLKSGITATDFFEQTEKREFAFRLNESGSFKCVSVNGTPRIAEVVFASCPGIEYSLPEEFWNYFVPLNCLLPLGVDVDVKIQETPAPQYVHVETEVIDKETPAPVAKSFDESKPIIHTIEAGEIRVLDDISVIANPRDPNELINFISHNLLSVNPRYKVSGVKGQQRIEALWELFELNQRQIGIQKLLRLAKREETAINEQLNALKIKYAD